MPLPVTSLWPIGGSAGASAAGAAASGASGVLALSPTAVALAAALILVQALVSVKYHLGLHTQLAVAAVRCVLQLSVLGYVLGERRAGAGCGGKRVRTRRGGAARGAASSVLSALLSPPSSPPSPLPAPSLS